MAGVLFFALALLCCPSPFSLLFALAVHEAGHLAVGALLGFGTPEVSFPAAGIRLSFPKSKRLLPSLALALGGSLFGAAAALFPFASQSFRFYSLGFSILSLLPVSCLDGGGALLLLLEAFMLPDRAYRIARAVSVTTVLLVWALSCAVQLKTDANLTLLAVSAYLTVSALSPPS